MKILVTGATGLLGRHLVARLLKEEHEVIALGRNQLIGQSIESQGAQFVACDLTDLQTMTKAAAGTKAIIHCGALSKPWGPYQAFYEANVLGTKNALQCARMHEMERFIHISSPSIYFKFCNLLNINENTLLPKSCANHYIKTKKESESVVDKYASHGLNTITIRPRAIFGPYDTTIFPRILNTVKNDTFPLINQGKAIIDITYVDNVVEAICMALQAPSEAFGQKFNITNDEPMALKDILDKLFKLLNINIRYKPIPSQLAFYMARLMEIKTLLSFNPSKEPRLTRYGVGVLTFDQTLDLKLAKDLLKYQPIVSIEQGLGHFARWWRGNHDK